jgi:hypothetical protein
MTADPVLLKTSRGNYRLTLAEEAERASGQIFLTLAMEHAGGLEKFAFRCRVAQALLQKIGISEASAICSRLSGWLERDFEAVREAALKSIRAERRLAEFNLDESIPGFA